MTDTPGIKVDQDVQARVNTVSKLVDFQEGGIASRTLIESPASTVTLFAFDKGQALSEHTAPFNALVCVTEGVLEITLAGAPHTVNAGQMIVMPPDVPHALRANEKSIMILTMIKE